MIDLSCRPPFWPSIIKVALNGVVNVKGVGVGLQVENLAVAVKLDGHHRFVVEWLAYLQLSTLTIWFVSM